MEELDAACAKEVAKLKKEGAVPAPLHHGLPCDPNHPWQAEAMKKAKSMSEEEKRVAREAEEDMMRKRLGLPPLKRQTVATGVRLDERERKDLLKRGGAGMT